MPVFRKQRLLFIHIPKNAGRSIERALLGGDGSPDGGRRSVLSRAAKSALTASQSAFAEETLIGTIDRSFAAQHLTYQEMDLLGLLSDEDKRYSTFSVCRNPFDRAVSSLGHFTTAGLEPHVQSAADFERLLLAWLDRPLADHNDRAHRRPQIDYVLDCRGRPVAQTVLRYETLSADFEAFMAAQNLPGITLPWHGKSERARHYQDYFTPAGRQAVEAAFGEDLDHFGYAF